MPRVHIEDDLKYSKAIGLLLDRGGFFWTKPARDLVVNAGQMEALQRAGLVSPNHRAPEIEKRLQATESGPYSARDWREALTDIRRELKNAKRRRIS